MSKRIIFLEAVQNYGGARISTVELAERLSDNYSVKIVDFYGSCLPFINDVEKRGIKLDIIEPRNSPYIISGSQNKIINNINRLRFIPHILRIRKKLKKIIKSFSADYIVVNNYKTLSVLYSLNMPNIKVLFFARGWFVPQKISPLRRHLLKKVVDKYICVSEATRHALFCGGFASLDNLHVVHNAIDEEKLNQSITRLKENDDTTVILHAGGFLPEKGQEVSLEIAKRLKEKGLDFKIVLAGLIYKGHRSANFYEKIKTLIDKYQLQNYVSIVEGNTNIISYFRGADIVIHPSDTEGLPRVVMEAMCLQKPVIANAVGGVTDFILSGYTGYITDYNKIDDYVAYIELLIANPPIKKFITDNAYALIKTSFTPDVQIQSFSKILNSH